jgi:uncharacterized protein YbjT (DUF2867 family)
MELGAQVIVGDMLSLPSMRSALEGIESAYFVYPLATGVVEAAIVFAQAAKENGVGHIVNLSHKQAMPDARSQATLNHWLTEQIFTWAGVPTTHLRVTFFADWMLNISTQIRQGRYVTPFDAESRVAPMATCDIGRIVAGILHNPVGHAGKIYPLHGPTECSHQDLASYLSQVLGKLIRYEQVSVEQFVKLLGAGPNAALSAHLAAMKIDKQEGRLEGRDNTGIGIMGQLLLTPMQFIQQHRDHFI